MTGYEAFIAPQGHNGGELEIIKELALRQKNLEDQVDELDEKLKAAKKELREVSEDLLPEKMSEVGLENFSYQGILVTIKDDLEVYVSEERRESANKWLEDNSLGAIIKSEVIAAFGREELSKAHQLVETLLKDNRPAALKRSVHASTLKATIREELKTGKDIPLDLFGVRQFKVSKIKIKRES